MSHSLGLLLQHHIDVIHEELTVAEAPDTEKLISVILPEPDYALFEALCWVMSEVLLPALHGCTMHLKLDVNYEHDLTYFHYSIVFNRRLDFQRQSELDALTALASMARYTNRHNVFEVTRSHDTELLLVVETHT